MIMKGKIFPCICLILLIGFGCKDKNSESCMDVSFGQVNVDPENKFPIPYHGNQTLVFLDSLGQELKLTSLSFFSPYYFDAIDTIREGACAGEAVVYGKLETQIFTFRNDSLGHSLSVQHSVNLNLDEDQPVLFDLLLGNYYKSGSMLFYGANFHFVTDDRGNDVSSFFDRYEYVDEITLRSKTFSHVYYGFGVNNTAVYFNLEVGFVGFREEGGALWVLDRIE